MIIKQLYWKPQSISRRILCFLAFTACLGIWIVEANKVAVHQPHYEEKIQAAEIMQKGMDTIKAYRTAYIGPIDTQVDPTASGMIGVQTSSITSNKGYLNAKDTTVNPNWAAVVVDMLFKAGVKKGDTIAAGFSGSFPAMNLAVLSASHAMELNLIPISSVAASNWGANLPRLTWLDMESLLSRKKVTSHRSVAASLGGGGDQASFLTPRGQQKLMDAIQRNNVPLIDVPDFTASIDARMQTYEQQAAGKEIKAYINVGGGTVSVGTKKGKRLYQPGLNKYPPLRALAVDSVMSRFARQGTPVIHITKIRAIASQYGLPFSPNKIPPIGKGPIYEQKVYSPWLAGVILLCLFLLWIILVKTDLANSLFYWQLPEKFSLFKKTKK